MLQKKQLIRNLIILTIASIIMVTSITILEINEEEYREKYMKKASFFVNYLIDHGLYQKVNKSCTDKGVRLTVDYIVGDRKNLYIFYTTEDLNQSEFRLEGTADILDESGTSLLEGVGLTTCPIHEGSKSHLITMVIKYSTDAMIPKNLKVKCNRFVNSEHEDIKGNWEVNISMKNRLMTAEPKIYSINKNIILHDLKFNIKEIKAYPTISQIVVDYSASDNKEFSFFRTYIITDNKTYDCHWIIGPQLEDYDNKIAASFDSIYFDKPLKLSLYGNDIMYFRKGYERSVPKIIYKEKFKIDLYDCHGHSFLKNELVETP